MRKILKQMEATLVSLGFTPIRGVARTTPLGKSFGLASHWPRRARSVESQPRSQRGGFEAGVLPEMFPIWRTPMETPLGSPQPCVSCGFDEKNHLQKSLRGHLDHTKAKRIAQNNWGSQVEEES